jgi:hypothetical protein
MTAHFCGDMQKLCNNFAVSNFYSSRLFRAGYIFMFLFIFLIFAKTFSRQPINAVRQEYEEDDDEEENSDYKLLIFALNNERVHCLQALLFFTF